MTIRKQFIFPDWMDKYIKTHKGALSEAHYLRILVCVGAYRLSGKALGALDELISFFPACRSRDETLELKDELEFQIRKLVEE